MAGAREMGLTCRRSVISSSNLTRMSPLNQEHGKSPRAGPCGYWSWDRLVHPNLRAGLEAAGQNPGGLCLWRVLLQGAAPGHPSLPSHLVPSVV